jgi:predicted PurR-regulated permease PerM
VSVGSAEVRVTERKKARAAAEATQAQASAPQPMFSKAAEGSLIILCVIACGFVLWAAQSVLVPVAVAVVVALCLSPVVRVIEGWGVPTPVAAVLVVAAAAAGIAAGAIAIAPGISQWVERAPEIISSIEAKTRSLQAGFQDFQAASNKLDELANAPRADGSGPQQVTVVEPLAGGLLQSAPVVAGQAAFVVVLALFLIMVREPYRKRLILLPRTRVNRLRVARIMNETLSHVSHYLFVVACINFGLGAVTALAFAIAGVPYALVWGFVFAVANFIPYIGPTGTMILCALVQLATANTLVEAAIPPLIMFALNQIESTFVTPWLVSRRVAVSSLAVFLTVTIFLWLWGPLAAIVAVPLLILFGAIARHVPGLEPIAVLLLPEHEANLEITETARARFFADEAEMRKKPWWRVPRRETVRPRPVPAAVIDPKPGEA